MIHRGLLQSVTDNMLSEHIEIASNSKIDKTTIISNVVRQQEVINKSALNGDDVIGKIERKGVKKTNSSCGW